MSEQDILEELRKLGINPGAWQKTEGSDVREPEFIKQQKDHFAKILPFLEKQLADDVQTLAQLREMKKRAKYGGGM